MLLKLASSILQKELHCLEIEEICKELKLGIEVEKNSNVLHNKMGGRQWGSLLRVKDREEREGAEGREGGKGEGS